MSKFKVRHQIEVDIAGTKAQVVISELPYQRFLDIQSGVGLPEERRGLEMLKALCLQCLENADGTPMFTEETWVEETLTAQKALYKASMEAHGVKFDDVAKKAEETTPEQVEGNG